jgi:hypothetical protein
LGVDVAPKRLGQSNGKAAINVTKPIIPPVWCERGLLLVC